MATLGIPFRWRGQSDLPNHHTRHSAQAKKAAISDHTADARIEADTAGKPARSRTEAGTRTEAFHVR
jgi:hypothetical protein